MKMFIVLKANEDFDSTKLDHALVTFKTEVLGRYNWVAYLADVTVAQAKSVVATLEDDETIETFTPLLEYSL